MTEQFSLGRSELLFLGRRLVENCLHRSAYFLQLHRLCTRRLELRLETLEKLSVHILQIRLVFDPDLIERGAEARSESWLYPVEPLSDSFVGSHCKGDQLIASKHSCSLGTY